MKKNKVKVESYFIEELKKTFSRFCQNLVKEKNVEFGKLQNQKDLIISLIIQEYLKGKISKEYCDKSIHYINKCYIITFKKLNCITHQRYFSSK